MQKVPLLQVPCSADGIPDVDQDSIFRNEDVIDLFEICEDCPECPPEHLPRELLEQLRLIEFATVSMDRVFDHLDGFESWRAEELGYRSCI